MLGEQLFEESGQITLQRVLPSTGSLPLIEASFVTTGTFRGIEYRNTGTFEAVAQPDGTLRGDGQGLSTTVDGDMVTWTGNGVGRPGEGGAVSWRGVFYNQTASERFVSLNGLAVIFEFDVDAEGNITSKGWEWT